MPQISFFLGIVIRMFYRDHNPPHFHAVYAEYEGLIDINKLELIGGSLPPRVLGLVIEWTALHQQELLDTGIKQDCKSHYCKLHLWFNKRILIHGHL